MDSNNFDPDAYLAANSQGQNFDPDAYLAANAPQQSGLESAARGFARNVPLAQQGIAAAAPILNKVGLADKPDYSGELQHLTEAAEQGKKENPGSYYTGAALGTVAPMAIPGVGEALEAAPILGNATLGGLQAVSDTSLTTEPMKAAGEAALGAGIGGATAGILGKVLPTKEGIENAASNSAVKSTIWNRNYLGRLEPDEIREIGDFMKEHGIVNHNTEEALAQAEQVKTSYGKLIEEIGADAQPLKNPQPFLNDLMEEANKYKGLKNPEFRKLANTYAGAVNDIKSLGDNPTFGQLQELKRAYGKIAFKQDHSVGNEAAADIYHTLRDMMFDAANDSTGQYKQALKGYGYASDIVNGLDKKLGSLRNPPQGIGLGSISRVVRQMPGSARLAAGLGAAAMGHPYIAGMAALPEVMNPALHSEALSGLSRMLPTLAPSANMELANALESKFGPKEKRK